MSRFSNLAGPHSGRRPLSRHRLINPRSEIRLLLPILALLLSDRIAEAQWAILHGKNAAVTQHVPAEISRTVTELRKRGGVLKSITFAPRGGWVILSNKNDLLARGISDDAFEALTAKAKEGAELKSVAFAPNGGWVVLFDKNGHVESNVPEELVEKLKDLAGQGADLKSVSFSQNGGWVILHGKNALFARNIPDEAYQSMIDPERKNAELRCATFPSQGGWCLIFEKGLVVSRDLPDAVQKTLTDLQKRKTDLRSISLDPTFSISISDDDEQTRDAILERMQHFHVPGLSIAVIDDGRLKWARGYGVMRAGSDEPVTDDTQFQAASVSKPVAALAALRLVQQGKLKLDADLNQSLVSWKIPENPVARRKPPVLRQLLSHTAGFTVHGFAGYERGQPLPTLKQILKGESPANSAVIRVEFAPGTKWQYSGGGYCVLQQLLEDVSGQPFSQLMREQVLDPVKMMQSTFEQSPPEEKSLRRSTAHDGEGQPIAGDWHLYPEMAAAGLWTTPGDLARLVIALSNANRGDDDAILPPALIKAMLTPQPQSESFGLGLSLAGKGKSQSFSHGGVNAGFRCLLVGYPAAGKGIVIMTNADSADPLIHEIAAGVRKAFDWPE